MTLQAMSRAVRPAAEQRVVGRARALVAAAALAGLALAAVVSLNSRAWVGRTFPGFFVMANQVIASVSLPDWFAIHPSRLFQHAVIGIDGEAVADSADIYRRVAARPPGTSITYALRNDHGDVRQTTLRTHRFSSIDWYLVFGIYLVNGISFLAIGLAVFWLRPEAAASRGLLSACLAAGAFAITAVDLYGPHWFFRLHAAAECLLGAGLLHLALVFPTNRLGPHPRRRLLALYLPFFVLIAVYQVFLYDAAAYTVVHLIANSVLGLAGIPLMLLVGYDLLTARSPLVRRRTRFVVLGTVAGFGPPAVLMAGSGLFGGEIPVNAAGLTAPLFPLALGYAIVTRNLFDIDFMLRRVLAHAALLAAVAMLGVGAALLAGALLPERGDLLWSPYVLVPVNLGLLLIFVMLRGRVQRIVDSLFFPEEYDGAAAVGRFSHALASAHDSAAVVQTALHTLAETCQPLRAAIYMHAGGHRYVRRADDDPTLPASITVPVGIDGRDVVVRDEADQRPGLPPLWRGLGAEMLVMVRDADTPIALLALGAKSSGRTYSFHDVTFLRTVSAQLAVALTKAEAFERLREEGDIAAALGRVSQAMISTLDAPLVLDRLCEQAVDVLDCDCAHTLLRDPRSGVFLPRSRHGDDAEEWEQIRLLQVPAEMLGDLLDRLANDSVVIEAHASGAPQRVLAAVLRHASGSAFIALRRGGELIGILAAGYRRGRGRFDARARRIAAGIAQTASMALANVRLVEELEQANRIKSQFVDSMSHELRTPLNHIIGYNDLVIDGVFGELNAEQADALQRVQRSSRELLGMIESVLSLSRLEKDSPTLEAVHANLAALFDDVAAQTDERAHANPAVTVHWQVDRGMPGLRTDPVKLKMVVRNLVENALKFTPSGEVRVRARVAGNELEIAVSDTGIGIDPANRELIFEPFRKAEATAFHEGVGLGLFIVRRLVALLGGTLELDSEVGRGSCFRIRLPLPDHADSEAAVTLVA